MNSTMAKRMGESIGSFEFIECNEDNFCWGGSLKVCVSIDILKPLRRGVKVNFDGPMGGCWIPIKYELLPNFCYHCGMIGHTVKDCEIVLESEDTLFSNKKQYDPWLRYQRMDKGGTRWAHKKEGQNSGKNERLGMEKSLAD